MKRNPEVLIKYGCLDYYYIYITPSPHTHQSPHTHTELLGKSASKEISTRVLSPYVTDRFRAKSSSFSYSRPHSVGPNAILGSNNALFIWHGYRVVDRDTASRNVALMVLRSKGELQSQRCLIRFLWGNPQSPLGGLPFSPFEKREFLPLCPLSLSFCS